MKNEFKFYLTILLKKILKSVAMIHLVEFEKIYFFSIQFIKPMIENN